MNKAEIIADLKSRVVKIIKTYDPGTLNGGDREYSFTCLVLRSGDSLHEEDYSIRVVDEGLPTEIAGYVNGKTPATREQKLKTHLDQLQKLGKITVDDLSNLGIQFANISIDGVKKSVAELDGELISIDGE